jgi:hypothetical protein
MLGDGVGAMRLLLASAPTRSGHLGMWESYSMTIVGLRAPVTPLFYMALCEGGSTATDGRRPRSGRGIGDRGLLSPIRDQSP